MAGLVASTSQPTALDVRAHRAPSSGSALGLRIPVGFGFDSPTGYLIRTWRSLGSRQVGDLEIAGSNPAVLTGNKRAEVQMVAHLFRELEVPGSTPGCPTWRGSRGLVAQTRLITE